MTSTKSSPREGRTLHLKKVHTGGWAHLHYQHRAENQWRENAKEIRETAVQLAEQVRSGRVTSRVLTEQALARIAARDGDIGAFQVVRLSRRQREPGRVAERIDRGVDLGAQAAPAPADGFIAPAFLAAPALC